MFEGLIYYRIVANYPTGTILMLLCTDTVTVFGGDQGLVLPANPSLGLLRDILGDGSLLSISFDRPGRLGASWR